MKEKTENHIMNGLLLAVILILLLLGWNVYEKFSASPTKEQGAKTVVQGKINESTKPKIVLYNREPCEKPKLRHRAKPKHKVPPVKTVIVAAPAVAPQPVAQQVVEPVIPTAPPSAVVETAESKPLLDGTDPDYGKTAVEFTPLPEKEAPPKRRRVVVVEQSPYYYGGYGGGYYNAGYQYPYYYTQPVFTPAPQVITPAPSVVRPPSVVTGPPGPGVVTRGPPSVITR